MFTFKDRDGREFHVGFRHFPSLKPTYQLTGKIVKIGDEVAQLAVAKQKSGSKIKGTVCTISAKDADGNWSVVTTATTKVHNLDRSKYTNTELKRYGIMKSLGKALLPYKDMENPPFDREMRMGIFNLMITTIKTPKAVRLEREQNAPPEVITNPTVADQEPKASTTNDVAAPTVSTIVPVS